MSTNTLVRQYIKEGNLKELKKYKVKDLEKTFNPVEYAVYFNKINIIKYLLDNGADVDKNKNNVIALWTAYTHDYGDEKINFNLVKLLLNYNANVYIKYERRTFIQHFLEQIESDSDLDLKILRLLLKRDDSILQNIDFSMKNSLFSNRENFFKFNSYLSFHVFHGDVNYVKLLLKYSNVNVNKKDKTGSTALHYVCAFGHDNSLQIA